MPERVPISRIRKIVEEKLPESETQIVEELSEEILGIPGLICAIPANNVFFSHVEILPMSAEIIERYNELYAILVRVSGRPGSERDLARGSSIFPWELHKVVVEGREYYVGNVSDEGVDLEYCSKKEIEESHEGKNMILYPCDLIDPEK